MVDSRQMYPQGSVERRKMNVVETLSEQLSEIGYPNERVRTGLVRSLSSKSFRQLDSKQPDLVFEQCERLLAERDWALSVIAFDWAYSKCFLRLNKCARILVSNAAGGNKN